MKPGKVRAIALCIFHNEGRILAARGYDPVKNQIFYRPLGGTIEFSEPAASTVVREIQEELNLEAAEISYLGTLENIFTFAGKSGHEIVMIFDGKFVDSSVYNQATLQGKEGDNEPILAEWIKLEDYSAGNAGSHPPLYPTGLFELLQGLK
jgi:8-oxo-dGTP pyrophosphatase MutT (NUDIX family)